MSGAAPGAGPDIEVLFDIEGGPPPTAAERRYGGPLRIVSSGSPHVFANFVSTLDGVVSLGLAEGNDSSAISGRHPADRYVMALLRASAAAVMIGAGTLAASAGHRWEPGRLAPEHRAELEELRRAAALPPEPPPLLVVSAGGRLPEHAAFEGRVVVITTEAGAGRVRRDHPSAEVAVAGPGPSLDGPAIVAAAAAAAGDPRLLCEGGPKLMGTLIRERLVAELFLSISALIAGRGSAERPGLVAGAELPPTALQHAQLRSVRRSGDLLLLRYRLDR
ncbi:MAG: dihydrofolate reductase family protein [Candidatus Dormibacteraeota bacterium]|nr:dihydrofolate reductase family protein [Candidatus Dormibacteraeota bacterium]